MAKMLLFHGERCWARGYVVSTVDFEKEKVLKYQYFGQFQAWTKARS
jgi:hypothetical protein